MRQLVLTLMLVGLAACGGPECSDPCPGAKSEKTWQSFDSVGGKHIDIFVCTSVGGATMFYSSVQMEEAGACDLLAGRFEALP